MGGGRGGTAPAPGNRGRAGSQRAASLLNLHWLQRGRQPGMLAGLDALAGRVAGLFDTLPAGWVFTDAEPMDEPGERADLLLLTR